MNLKKAQPGDPFRPSIKEQNALVDLANAAAEGGGLDTRRRVPIYDPVRVQNNSGSDREQWDALGIGGLVVSETDNADELLSQRFAIDGKQPAWPDHIGRWVLCLEPIGSDEIGLAAIGGIVAAQINVIHADHDRADIPDNAGAGGNGPPDSAFQGEAEIIYKESGTGLKWALLRLGKWASPLLEARTTGSSIAADASGTVTVQWNDSDSESITAHNDHMHAGASAQPNKDIELYFHRVKGHWSIIELEC